MNVTGAELSIVVAKSSAGNVLLPVETTRDDDGTTAALSHVPEHQVMPDSEVINRSDRRGGFCPGGAPEFGTRKLAVVE